MKVYFAHPLSDYNTDYEKECIKSIKSYFHALNGKQPDIVNPNKQIHQTNYDMYGMGYFIGLVTACDICVAVPFADEIFSAGVWKELKSVDSKIVLHNGKFRNLKKDDVYLNIEQTRERMRNYRARGHKRQCVLL